MKKLFMIAIGGKVNNANIEVHDIQFIIAESIEETYKVLKENWYGIELKLHIDSYKEIKGADGYQIEISETAVESDNRLYFANIGGYNELFIGEVHRSALVVGDDFNTVKNRCNKMYLNDFKQPHLDNLVDVYKSPLLNTLYDGYIKLVKSDFEYDLKPDWHGYKRLDQ